MNGQIFFIKMLMLVFFLQQLQLTIINTNLKYMTLEQQQITTIHPLLLQSKVKEQLLKIIKDGGLFCGGFVRDYLIRGKQFNDIDFYFPSKTTEPYASWPFIGGAKTQFFEGTKFHCGTSPYDLTCNVFSFDGEKIIARPTFMMFSYVRSWEMIFRKEFIFTEIKDASSAAKMQRRGWGKLGSDFRKRTEPLAPSAGPWSDFTMAAERFHALTRL